MLMFDLDDQSSEAWAGKEKGPRSRVGTAPYFHTHSLDLQPDEPFDFEIVAETSGERLVEWILEIEYEVLGKRRVLKVSDGDQPFRTNGRPAVGFEHEWLCRVASPGAGFTSRRNLSY
jgi:hypothetical protein